MPLCFSISIQSEVADLRILLLFTAPATCIAPPKSSSFSVSVVLPASGCAMTAKVLLLDISSLLYFISCSLNVVIVNLL